MDDRTVAIFQRCVRKQADIVRAQIELAAMQADNEARAAHGLAPAYTSAQLLKVIDDNGIGHNSVMQDTSL